MVQKQMKTKTENVLRPSNFQRASKCAAAPWLEARCPDTDSEAAREGALLHEHIAEYLRNDCQGMPDLWSLDDEQVAVVMACVEFAREKTEGADQVFVEQPVHYGLLDRDVTPDVVAVFDGGERRLVIDWKCGYADWTEGGWPAKEDLQLACYALAYGGGSRAVEVWRFHPRLWGDARQTGATFRFEAWPEWEKALKKMTMWVSAAGDAFGKARINPPNDSWTTPGEQQCLYCRAKDNGLCEAYKKWSGEAVEETALAEKREFTPARVAEILSYGPRLKLAQKVFKKSEDRAREILSEGGEITSPDGTRWGLRDSGSRRDFVGTQEAADCWEASNLPPEAFEDELVAPIGAIERRYKELTGLKGREAKACFNEDMGGAITRTPKRPSVVAIKEAENAE